MGKGNSQYLDNSLIKENSKMEVIMNMAECHGKMGTHMKDHGRKTEWKVEESSNIIRALH